jgi:hypothetical protein
MHLHTTGRTHWHKPRQAARIEPSQVPNSIHILANCLLGVECSQHTVLTALVTASTPMPTRHTGALSRQRADSAPATTVAELEADTCMHGTIASTRKKFTVTAAGAKVPEETHLARVREPDAWEGRSLASSCHTAHQRSDTGVGQQKPPPPTHTQSAHTPLAQAPNHRHTTTLKPAGTTPTKPSLLTDSSTAPGRGCQRLLGCLLRYIATEGRSGVPPSLKAVWKVSSIWLSAR